MPQIHKNTLRVHPLYIPILVLDKRFVGLSEMGLLHQPLKSSAGVAKHKGLQRPTSDLWGDAPPSAAGGRPLKIHGRRPRI